MIEITSLLIEIPLLGITNNSFYIFIIYSRLHILEKGSTFYYNSKQLHIKFVNNTIIIKVYFIFILIRSK